MRKSVKIGTLWIGGDHPIAIQSMVSVPSYDVPGSVAQAKALEAAGCQILRIAVPDREAVGLINAIKREVSIPLVADIHFDYRLALEAAAAGIDKIRINPGNIGEDSRVKQVADCCARKGIPIRIGVNSGSVEREILAKYGAPTPEALVESALYHISLLERYDFDQIVVSIKASQVPTMVAAYRLIANKCSYPLHLGVTEAGTERMGLIKNAMGIGALLLDGIGDTIRCLLYTSSIRAGRANPSVLDKIRVDYYGTPTQINQMAAVSVSEARILVIQPWDKTTLKSIEKAILASDLGINPQNDGSTIRIVFPPLTEERRKELGKQILKYGEEAKVAIRSIRRDGMEKFKAMKKAGDITEDDLKAYEKDIQDLTDKYCKNIDTASELKKKEIMEL